MRTILIILFSIISLHGFGQVSPSKIYRVADSTKVFGAALASGNLLCNTGNKKTYRILLPQAGTRKITDMTLGTDYTELINVQGVPTSRTITTTAPLTIGGTTSADLSANRTIAISAATTGAAGSMSATDKTKLDGIASGATNYAHPTGDGYLHVTATSTTNNGKVLTAGATAGSFSWTENYHCYLGPWATFGSYDLNALNVVNKFSVTSFLYTSTNAFPMIDNANAVITISTYPEAGYYHQLGFNDDGEIYSRHKGNAWKKVYSSGNLTNTLTTNSVPKWNGSTLVNSIITQGDSSINITFNTNRKQLLITNNSADQTIQTPGIVFKGYHSDRPPFGAISGYSAHDLSGVDINAVNLGYGYPDQGISPATWLLFYTSPNIFTDGHADTIRLSINPAGFTGLNTRRQQSQLDVRTDDKFHNIRMSESKSNSVQRTGLVSQPYTLTDKPFGLIGGYAESGINAINIGYGDWNGATGTVHSAMSIDMYTTPTITGSPVNRLSINKDGLIRAGAFELYAPSVSNTFFSSNMYFDGTWKYRATGYAGFQNWSNGQFSLWTSQTGNADAAASPTKVFETTSTGILVTGQAVVTDDAYDADWDGMLSVPTKNAIYDKLLTMIGGDTHHYLEFPEFSASNNYISSNLYYDNTKGWTHRHTGYGVLQSLYNGSYMIFTTGLGLAEDAVGTRNTSWGVRMTVDSTGINLPSGSTYKVNGVPVNGGEVIYSLKKSISIDSLNYLYERPITLISAPGTGKAIRVLDISIRINYVTSAFNANGLTFFTRGCNPSYYLNDLPFKTTSSRITIAQLPMGITDFTTNNSVYLKENEPFFVGIYGAVDNSSGGGSIDLYLTYRIITL